MEDTKFIALAKLVWKTVNPDREMGDGDMRRATIAVREVVSALRENSTDAMKAAGQDEIFDLLQQGVYPGDSDAYHAIEWVHENCPDVSVAFDEMLMTYLVETAGEVPG